MTAELEDYDVRQAGSIEYDKSLDEDERFHEEGTEREFELEVYESNGDINEEERLEQITTLGVASYLEDIVTGEETELKQEDLVDYMVENPERVDFEALNEYKGEMANDHEKFGDVIIDTVTEAYDRLRAKAALSNAVSLERAEERDSAQRAIQNIYDEFPVDQFGEDDGWTPDLEEITRREREAQERFEDLEERLDELK